MKINPLWISIIVFATLAILFAFTDLPIMQKVANPESGWAHFMELYGQLPGALVGFMGGSVLFALYKVQKNFKSIAGVIGLSILVLFTSFGFWMDALGAQGGDMNPLMALGLGIVMLIVVQIILRRLPKEHLAHYIPVAQVAFILLFVAGIITVWAIKIPWGRWTYRDMLEVGDLTLFTPWYLPQGNNGHHSFISGHTAIAFCVLPVVLLFRDNKRHYQIAWILALAWGVIGAISRVAIGAHFPSDVLFGGGQTLLWFWILQNKFSSGR
jgi:membrane-associated phospholipid phosphatase